MGMAYGGSLVEIGILDYSASSYWAYIQFIMFSYLDFIKVNYKINCVNGKRRFPLILGIN